MQEYLLLLDSHVNIYIIKICINLKISLNICKLMFLNFFLKTVDNQNRDRSAKGSGATIYFVHRKRWRPMDPQLDPLLWISKKFPKIYLSNATFCDNFDFVLIGSRFYLRNWLSGLSVTFYLHTWWLMITDFFFFLIFLRLNTFLCDERINAKKRG